MTATHRGEIMGIPATGKSFGRPAIDLIRVSGGKIVEPWARVDRLGMMQQLGGHAQSVGR